jgi:hypothetical protein
MSRHIEFDLKKIGFLDNTKIYPQNFTNKIEQVIWWTVLAKMSGSYVCRTCSDVLNPTQLYVLPFVIVYMYNVYDTLYTLLRTYIAFHMEFFQI